MVGRDELMRCILSKVGMSRQGRRRSGPYFTKMELRAILSHLEAADQAAQVAKQRGEHV